MGLIDPLQARRQRWAATRWSVVTALDAKGEPHWHASWTYLVETYRAPMERYVRGVLSSVRGTSYAEAETVDVVQEFLTACIEKDWLSRADPLRGRFRAYVQALLRRFVYGYLRRTQAQKRSPGPDRKLLPLIGNESLYDLGIDERAALRDFNEGWVKAAIGRSIERLSEESKRYADVIRDLIATDGEGSEDMAERVGVRRAQLPVVKFRARQRLRDLLLEEFEATVGSEQALEEELQALASYIPYRSGED